MDSVVIASLINAGGTLTAAGVGVAGVYAIIKHRHKVRRLSQQVEAYYHLEGELAREVHRLENHGATITDDQLPALRRKLRNRLVKNGQRPTMTATQAAQLRDQIL